MSAAVATVSRSKGVRVPLSSWFWRIITDGFRYERATFRARPSARGTHQRRLAPGNPAVRRVDANGTGGRKCARHKCRSDREIAPVYERRAAGAGAGLRLEPARHRHAV